MLLRKQPRSLSTHDLGSAVVPYYLIITIQGIFSFLFLNGPSAETTTQHCHTATGTNITGSNYIHTRKPLGPLVPDGPVAPGGP